MNHATTTKGVAMTRRSAVAGLAPAGAALAAPSIARGADPRIVTVGGGVTETVFALGRGRDVVATDAASLHPLGAAALPRCRAAEGELSQGAVHA